MAELSDNAEAGPAIFKYFEAVRRMKASDLHLKVGLSPRLRIDGAIVAVNSTPLTQETIEKLIFEILDDEQKQQYIRDGAIDLALELPGSDRFRLNVFRQRGHMSVAARRVSRRIPSFVDLHLPERVTGLSELRQGLVLVSGVTGAGKSTTIAAMVEHINQTRACHIVTIEDPIEYLYEDKQAFINQREVGIDVDGFSEALRHLMREDPDVVVVGEMRDRETFQAAMTAAETGHLVFGTLHTSSASQTLTRILDMFPQAQHALLRQSMIFTLRGIICQRLVRGIRPDTPLAPAVEVMVSTPTVRKLIAEEREGELPELLRGGEDGMQDFNESLRQLVVNEMIDHKTAYEASPNHEDLKMRLRGISGGQGGILSDRVR